MPSRKKVKKGEIRTGHAGRGAGIEEQKGGGRTSNVGVALRTVAGNGRPGGAGKCFPFLRVERNILAVPSSLSPAGAAPRKRGWEENGKKEEKALSSLLLLLSPPLSFVTAWREGGGRRRGEKFQTNDFASRGRRKERISLSLP